MANLEVTDTNVSGVIDKLRSGSWLIPKFQRDFVWSTDQVSSLIQSIIEARPIGMVTLWEQSETSQLDLEPVSIPDRDEGNGGTSLRRFGAFSEPPRKRFAVLDGRQRCTALAMAFGGFRAKHGLFRYSGRYYLDVTESDPRNRIKYFKETEVTRKHLDVDSTCVGSGLFPLASNKQESEELFQQWARYLTALHNPENYVDGIVPLRPELAKRNKILQDAFQGITETKLAVYTVAERYSLSDICDIFETLNTTGTKVSTVDLIHSLLYSDTVDDAEGPLLLREWINSVGQKNGAIGWASVGDRPELTAQFVTACYVALSAKEGPRAIGRGKAEPITSVKSGDLLSVPVGHWKAVRANEDLFVSYLGDAQLTVAGGAFPWTACPYPVSLAIYVALRWHAHFDDAVQHPWAREELDALFRAFFWRNALSRRYDQGFLTKLGSDLISLRDLLRTRPQFNSSSEWATSAQANLSSEIVETLPTRDELIELLTDGGQGGAIEKAMLLPMLAGARRDLVDSGRSLKFPEVSLAELHHVYPREWCRNNRTGSLAKLLDPNKASRDWINSVANRMPLSRESNNSWKQKNPSQFISERKLRFNAVEDVLRPIFIDKAGFDYLAGGTNRLSDFWTHRAELIADDLLRRSRIVL